MTTSKKGTIMAEKFDKNLFPEMTNFVRTNQKTLEEALEVAPLSAMPEEAADVMEVLQQSLLINGLFVNLLERYPKLMLKLINRSMK